MKFPAVLWLDFVLYGFVLDCLVSLLESWQPALAYWPSAPFWSAQHTDEPPPNASCNHFSSWGPYDRFGTDNHHPNGHFAHAWGHHVSDWSCICKTSTGATLWIRVHWWQSLAKVSLLIPWSSWSTSFGSPRWRPWPSVLYWWLWPIWPFCPGWFWMDAIPFRDWPIRIRIRWWCRRLCTWIRTFWLSWRGRRSIAIWRCLGGESSDLKSPSGFGTIANSFSFLCKI